MNTKRIYALAMGLGMMLAPVVAAPGLATADPGARSMDYQQAVSYTHLTLPTNREV